MAEVFISYSSTDSEKAKKVLTILEHAKISSWLSQRDIPPGADYAVEIPKAITDCDYFVLLLSNAAQNSPYVMLELDQAFKQKKEIIPILLEDMVQTEKANFFLNAKQIADGTKDLDSATHDVIQRIRSNSPAEQPAIIKASGPRDYIRCPHCGCTSLKQRMYYADRYFQYRTSSNPKETFAFEVRKNRSTIELIFTIISTLMVITIFACVLFQLVEDNAVVDYVQLLAGFILSLHVAFYFILNNSCDNLEDDLITTIKQSKMKYWTFHCGACEADFSVLVPVEDTLQERVEHLLKRKKK